MKTKSDGVILRFVHGLVGRLDLRQLRLHGMSVVAALAACSVAIGSIWTHPASETQDDLTRIIVILMLGVSFFLVPSLIFDGVRDFKRRWITILIFTVCFLLFVEQSRSWSLTYFTYKMIQGFVLSHLLVSLTPFLRRRLNPNSAEAGDGEEKKFWSENWFLLTRFQMAGIQTLFLMIGTLAALFSIEQLFNVTVKSELYWSVYAVFVSLVSVLLFIGSLGDRQSLIEPPEVLKRLVRTALTPLALLYFMILYSYIFKVAIAREWPRGGIGYLVSGLAFIISLSYVIMRPLASNEAFGPRLKRFWHFSFRLLIPPVLLLMLALGRRVNEYGWTEARVALGYLALWMLAISIYYWRPNRRSLAGIPVSLAVLFLVTWFGPLSPSSIDRHSQGSRLTMILAKDRAKLSTDDKREVTSILKHLCDTHGPKVMVEIAGANIPVDRVEAERRTINYSSSHYAYTCDDGFTGTGPNGNGYVSKVLAKLGIERVDDRTKQDFYFSRENWKSVGFENAQFAEVDLAATPKAEGVEFDDVWTTSVSENIKFRFNARLSKLEWSPEQGEWLKVDLKPVINFINENRDRKTDPAKNGDQSDHLRVVTTSRTRVVEIQIKSIVFRGADTKEIRSLSFLALARKRWTFEGVISGRDKPSDATDVALRSNLLPCADRRR